MREPKIHLARNGERLGVCAVSDARELLAAGFLRPTDDFWMAGQKEWLPLSALPASEGCAGRPLLKEARDTLAGVATQLRGKTVLVTKTVSTLLERHGARATMAGTRMLEDYLPRLREQALAGLQSLQRTADSALRDEVLLRRLFGAIYEALPKPAHRFVTEAQFVRFCLERRERLLTRPPAT